MTAMPVRFKVKVKDGQIFQNGVLIGGYDDYSAYLTVAGERKFFARHKYKSMFPKVRKIIKTVLSRMTVDEYFVARGDEGPGKSPCDIEARCLGYKDSTDMWVKTEKDAFLAANPSLMKNFPEIGSALL